MRVIYNNKAEKFKACTYRWFIRGFLLCILIEIFIAFRTNLEWASARVHLASGWTKFDLTLWMDADLLCKPRSEIQEMKRERERKRKNLLSMECCGVRHQLDCSYTNVMTHALNEKVSFMIAGQMSEPLVRRLIDGIYFTTRATVSLFILFVSFQFLWCFAFRVSLNDMPMMKIILRKHFYSLLCVLSVVEEKKWLLLLTFDYTTSKWASIAPKSVP